MLKIITTNIEKYNSLPLSEQTKSQTIYLVKDETNHQHSLYVGGLCFGENLNEEEIYSKLNEFEISIKELKKILNSFNIEVDLSDYYNVNDIATKADIDAIFK